MTTVVSVRGLDHSALMADPAFVYVARAVRWTPWLASIWGNPFPVKEGVRTAAEAVALYLVHLQARPDLLARLPELRGKRLGCWCCDWDGHGEPAQPCHAVALARLADGID